MDWTGPVWDFYRLMGAVLAANLLTVAFVWALMRYTQIEREGRERHYGGGYISTIIFVLGALAFGLLAHGFFDGLFS